jgi:hypothetical protein
VRAEPKPGEWSAALSPPSNVTRSYGEGRFRYKGGFVIREVSSQGGFVTREAAKGRDERHQHRKLRGSRERERESDGVVPRLRHGRGAHPHRGAIKCNPVQSTARTPIEAKPFFFAAPMEESILRSSTTSV